MAEAQVLEGTWDEIRSQAEELGRRSAGRRLKIVVTEESADPLAPDSRYGDYYNPLSIEELARRQGVEPITDVNAWYKSLPTIPEDEANGFYEILERNKRESREAERKGNVTR